MKKLLRTMFYSLIGLLTVLMLPLFFFACWLYELGGKKKVDKDCGRFDDDYA